MARHIKTQQTAFPIVAVRSFIEATRDTGYKSTASAIAELVDNAFEAQASLVDIRIENVESSSGKELVVRVSDNGTGMEPNILRLALQFGGSTRFGSRHAAGRFGMGLPNGSLSQARRVEVFTWMHPTKVWTTYLDVDEIISGRLKAVPTPWQYKCPSLIAESPTGTLVALTRCDRLDYRRVRTLEDKLIPELGQIFRKILYAGKRLQLNGLAVFPLDPLFLRNGQNPKGAHAFGPPLQYRVRVPSSMNRESLINVLFSELPVARWSRLSNEEKNGKRIAKHAGVSIVRANREIDYGWYFMGGKRKENYDDWWRCEISFSPDLDELFGVTHSKQKINPTEALSEIFGSEIERVARDLNSRVRRKYAEIRRDGPCANLIRKMETRDFLLEPPQKLRPVRRTNGDYATPVVRNRNGGIQGLRFGLSHQSNPQNTFYEATLREDRINLILNESHPFFASVYQPLANHESDLGTIALQHVLALLFAGARAECSMNNAHHRAIIRRFRERWGDALAAFLS